MSTKATANEIRDRVVARIQAHRLTDDHAAIRADLDRLMAYAHKVYAAAIPMLSVELQGFTADILAAWDMTVIQAMGEQDHAWACHEAAQSCLGMRKALAECRIQELRPELQLCHLVLESPWSVALEMAVEQARQAAVLSKLHPGITSIYGDYAILDECEPGDVDAAAVRAAVRAAREGCYGMMVDGGSVEIGNTQGGQQLDITTAFCAAGEAAIERIVKADHAKIPVTRTTMSAEPTEVAAAWQAMAREHGGRVVTAREVALSVERLRALEDYAPPAPSRPGIVLVLTGPSGAGKTSILEGLLAADGSIRRSVSATTREARFGEVEGRDYRFMADKAFDELDARGGLLERVCLHGSRYGIPRAPVEGSVRMGHDIVIVSDIQGYRAIKAAFPTDTLGICVLPPCVDDLKQRLLSRGDKPESVTRRMASARVEMDARDELEACVVNDSLPGALMNVLAILEERRDPAELTGGRVPLGSDQECLELVGEPGLLTADKHAGELEMAA